MYVKVVLYTCKFNHSQQFHSGRSVLRSSQDTVLCDYAFKIFISFTDFSCNMNKFF